MGDLISISPVATEGGAEADIAGAGAAWDAASVMGRAGMGSSAMAGPPFSPRLSLILESWRSNSNSVIEFFFIKSIIALISFKSTFVFVKVTADLAFIPEK